MTSMKSELVVARYGEDLSWLSDIAEDMDIVVYNKGPRLVQDFQRKVIVRPLINIGREAETFSRHLSQHYDDLADYTIFCQGAPLEHTPDFLHLLKDSSKFRDVQPLGRAYKIGEMPPAAYYDENMSIEELAEQIDLRTLDTQRFRDQGSDRIRSDYLIQHRLSSEVSVIHDMMNRLLGLHLSANITKGGFSWGAMFGVAKSRVAKYPKSFYDRLHAVSEQFHNHAWVLERCWLLIFGETSKAELAPYELRITLN